jgi:hypothetical protein
MTPIWSHTLLRRAHPNFLTLQFYAQLQQQPLFSSSYFHLSCGTLLSLSFPFLVSSHSSFPHLPPRHEQSRQRAGSRGRWRRRATCGRWQERARGPGGKRARGARPQRGRRTPAMASSGAGSSGSSGPSTSVRARLRFRGIVDVVGPDNPCSGGADDGTRLPPRTAPAGAAKHS